MTETLVSLRLTTHLAGQLPTIPEAKLEGATANRRDRLGILARLTGRSATASPAVAHVEREIAEAGFERPGVHAMSFRYLFCLVAYKPGSAEAPHRTV